MAIKIILTDKRSLQTEVDAAVFFVEQNFEFSKFNQLNELGCTNIERVVKDRKFNGSSNSVLISPCSNNKFGYVILVGLGKQKKDNIISFENYRRALGTLVRSLQSYSIKTISMQMPNQQLFNESKNYMVEHTAITLEVANYVFDDFITEDDSSLEVDATLYLIVDENEIKDLQKVLDEGLIIANAINTAREWVDLPSNLLSPADLSAKAVQIAQDYGLKCTVFHEKDINKMGMGGISAVSSGSEKDSCLVILEYKTEEKNAPTICFIGKGITFDSGGLSIKPAIHMETMKEDMAGAAAVISSMKALGQLKPKVNIVAITPIAENMPSGTSVRPGDIVKFYNGKTAEIKNTDAEGRLILADAMSYAVKHYKIDAMIDLATLTGACAYALGPYFAGLFSEHDNFVEQVFKAANLSGDYVWRLPLTDDYKPAVKAEVADLSNQAKREYQAGATTAACFLQHFVGDVPWVHLDIAGTAFNVPNVSYFRMHSATGFGVKLLIALAMNWDSKK